MRKHLVLLAAILFLVSGVMLSGSASAAMGIHERITNQQERINQGITSGSLTRSEADVLQGNLDYIRDTAARMKADGRLTPKEEKRLQNMLNDNSEMIRDKKHNRKVRRLY